MMVYLVGAGPGDPELLTLKGKKLIEKAEVILYDRLVNKSILSYKDDSCELIYVGKKNTEGGKIQEKINKILVDKALEGKIVVRLKGGDPFVFGRGPEEIDELIENNIPFEVVPGITSAIAVPSYAGIPVTSRGDSPSFHVFTGHRMIGEKKIDSSKLKGLDGTLIFLMGIGSLREIVDEVIKSGRSKDTEVAIIENGTTPSQRTTVGTLSNIVELKETHNIKAPGIIIIGDVVKSHKRLSWFTSKPLFGKRVLFTRDLRSSKENISLIEENGGYGATLPFIKISPRKIDYSQVVDSDVLLFNSQNGVKSFFDGISDIRLLSNKKIGVIGSKTLSAIRKYKVEPDFIPSVYNWKTLLEEGVNHISSDSTNKKITFITSSLSKVDTNYLGDDMRFYLNKIIGYDTEIITYSRDKVVESVGSSDYITFFSSSGVEGFVRSLGDDFDFTSINSKFVSIGRETSATMERLGLKVSIEAKVATGEGVIKAIVDDNKK